MQYMSFVYKTSKFAPFWATILKYAFRQPTLTEHALRGKHCFQYTYQ